MVSPARPAGRESPGVLRETTGKRWGRIWLAEPIRAAIETPPAKDQSI